MIGRAIPRLPGQDDPSPPRDPSSPRRQSRTRRSFPPFLPPPPRSCDPSPPPIMLPPRARSLSARSPSPPRPRASLRARPCRHATAASSPSPSHPAVVSLAERTSHHRCPRHRAPRPPTPVASHLRRGGQIQWGWGASRVAVALTAALHPDLAASKSKNACVSSTSKATSCSTPRACGGPSWVPALSTPAMLASRHI